MDAASFELTLLECSPCFTATSCARSQRLFHWIVGGRAGFCRWRQTSVHCLERGKDTLPMLVIFAPPQRRNLEQIHAVYSCENDVTPVNSVLDLSQEGNASSLCQNPIALSGPGVVPTSVPLVRLC